MKNKNRKPFYFNNKKADLAEFIASRYLSEQGDIYKNNTSKKEDINNINNNKQYIKRIKH